MSRRLPVIDARQEFERLITPLRARARKLGYALAVHGSLARDIDLIAVPWVEDVAPPEVLIESLRATIQEITGRLCWVKNDPTADPYDFTKRCPEPKPHARLAWSLYMSGSPTFFDISVMPTKPGWLMDAYDAIREEKRRVVGTGRADTIYTDRPK